MADQIDPNEVQWDQPSQDNTSAGIDPAEVMWDNQDVSPDQVKWDSESTQYQSPGQKALTAVEGAAKGAIGPLAPAIESAISAAPMDENAESALGMGSDIAQMQGLADIKQLGLSPEDQAAREEANPEIAKGTEAASLIGGLLTGTGEAGLIAKATENIAPEAAGFMAKAGAGALRGLIQGGLLQGSDEISKSILGETDPQTAVSSVVAASGLGALTGGLFGGTSAALSGNAESKVGSKIASWLAGIGSASKGQQLEHGLEEAKDAVLPASFSAGHKFYTSGLQEVINSAAKIPAELAGASVGETVGGYPGAYVGYQIAKKLSGPLANMLGKPITAISKATVPAILKVVGDDPDSPGLASRIYSAMDYANAANSGLQKINSGIGKLFSGSEQQIVNDLNPGKREKDLHKYLEENSHDVPKMEQTNFYAEGGNVEKPDAIQNTGLPTQDMSLNMAKSQALNYLRSIKPNNTAPKLAFDEPIKPVDAERSYQRALKLANQPLGILQHIQNGTIEPEHVQHLNGMYPGLVQTLQQKVTDQIFKAQLDGKKPPYKARMGLSLLMGTPLDGTMAPQNIQAAQASFAAQQQQPQQQQQNAPQKGRNKKNTSTLSKASQQYVTGAQARAQQEQKVEQNISETWCPEDLRTKKGDPLSTRSRIAPVTLPTINMASSANSTPTLLQSNTAFSYQISWTGTTPVGTLALQVSDDYTLGPNNNVINAGTWTTAPMDVNGAYATSISISGNTGNGVIDCIGPTGVNAVRLAYTAGSGTGTLTAVFTAKVA